MTTPSDAPTLGEIARRLDGIARQFADLLSSLDSTYIRKDVFEVRLHAVGEAIKELRVDADAIVEQQRKNRQLAISGIALPILTAIITALILSTILK
jgi:hypothetical protein